MSGWSADLEQLFAAVDARQAHVEERPVRPEVVRFFNDAVLPAFGELRDLLARHGRTAEVSSYLGDPDVATASIVVSKGSTRAIECTIRLEVRQDLVVPYVETHAWTRTGTAYAARSPIREGPQHYGMQDLTKEDIERSFVGHYAPMLMYELDETIPSSCTGSAGADERGDERSVGPARGAVATP